MGSRFTNSALLALAAILTLTGVYSLHFQQSGWVMDLHRVAAWGLVGLFPWKAAISYRSLRRGPAPTFDRSVGLIVSLVLAASTIAVVAFALAWMMRVGPVHIRLFGYQDTTISWHWLIGLVVLPALALHAWRRWPAPRRSEVLSRRGFVRLAGLSALGLIGWRAGEGLAVARHAGFPARSRTGAREAGSFEGNRFPVTTGAGDGRRPIDLAGWRLEVIGRVAHPMSLSYDQVLQLPSRPRIARLDCTIGWYTDQAWRGVRLRDLLDTAGIGAGATAVRLSAEEGYSHSLTLNEVEHVLLATHVGGEPLEHEHGFPLRAVVPTHRGWFWVKWLRKIEVIGRWSSG